MSPPASPAGEACSVSSSELSLSLWLLPVFHEQELPPPRMPTKAKQKNPRLKVRKKGGNRSIEVMAQLAVFRLGRPSVYGRV